MKNIPSQVWQLMIAYSLMMAGTSLMVLIAGIIGTQFAPSPGLATLPVALTIVGLALSTLPTGRLLDRFGRRKIFISYGFLAVTAALLAAYSLTISVLCCFRWHGDNKMRPDPTPQDGPRGSWSASALGSTP